MCGLGPSETFIKRDRFTKCILWNLPILQEINVSPESLKYIWYPELEIYGLERFGRQRVLKEMSGVRIRLNKTIHYELG